jgi:signal transduction histidine kinase/CheY-like chemotaxis protein
MVAWKIVLQRLRSAATRWVSGHLRQLRPSSDQLREPSALQRSGFTDPSKAERLDVILAGMTDGVMMLDADLRLVEWNAHFPEFAGIPEGMLRVGLPMADILHAQASAGEFGQVDVEAEVARRLELLRKGGSTGRIERIRPNGRTLELRRNPLPQGGFVTLYTDVTARRQAEEQLRQAQKMEAVGHLTGGVAHDFNNLLMIILSSLDRADRSLVASDLPKLGQSIQIARSGARRAASLTQRLLAFSRRQPREPRPIDVDALITDLAELIRQSAGRNVVELSLKASPWQVLADPNQLEIALLNLVINGRDAMPKGGSISIGTSRIARTQDPGLMFIPIAANEFVQITVQDTGFGMSQEVAARAFEPFFTTKGIGKGTGLGLHQVADFADQANGHVKIGSEPGIGTAVTIYLPCLPLEEHLQPSPSQANDVTQFFGRGEKVLVVENEPEIMAYTTEGLEAVGYQIIGAQDASLALTALENNDDIDIVFTDLGLPGIDGRQLAGEILRRWPKLPILYTSGGPVSTSTGNDPCPRDVSCIEKPYTLPTLARGLRIALDQRPQASTTENTRGLEQ